MKEALKPESASTLAAMEKTTPHLKIYPVKVIKSRKKPEAPDIVILVDQFDDYAKIKPKYKVGPLKDIATPTTKVPVSKEKDLEAPPPPKAPHYTWYPIKPVPEVRKEPPVPVFRVYVYNQFIHHTIKYFEISKATGLLVPTGKKHDRKSYPTPKGTTHYKVYPIDDWAGGKEGEYFLNDQFTLEKYKGRGPEHTVLPPDFFCVPCDKNHEKRSGEAHLLLYGISIAREGYSSEKIEMDDQFGTYVLETLGPEYLAVPTVKDRFSRIK